MNNRRKFLAALGAGAFVAPFSSFAQPQGKVWRIGFVTGRKGRPDPTFDTVVQALRELGYVEGKNLLMEYRAVGEMPERTASVVAELVQLKVDVIVSPTPSTIRAAKQATNTIPIVGMMAFDPVARGLVDNLARPGGNLTGPSRLITELRGKRLELLRDMMPAVARVGILWHTDNRARKEFEVAARALNLQIHFLEVRGSNPDLEGALQSAVKQRVQALIVARHQILLSYTRQIAELAIRHQLPSVCEGREFTDAGCLMSYATNDTESFKRAAYYVDKILKGAKPGDLPIEQPTNFELIINRKTAKALGLTIPQSLLISADKVIE